MLVAWWHGACLCWYLHAQHFFSPLLSSHPIAFMSHLITCEAKLYSILANATLYKRGHSRNLSLQGSWHKSWSNETEAARVPGPLIWGPPLEIQDASSWPWVFWISWCDGVYSSFHHTASILRSYICEPYILYTAYMNIAGSVWWNTL